MHSDADLARIAFVTRAYPRMRKQISALLLGPGLLAMLRGVRQDDGLVVFIGACVNLGMILILRLVDPWLDRRFGRIVVSGDDWDRHNLAPATFVVAVIVLASLSDLLGFGAPSSLLLLMPAAVGLWIFIRDWPYRPYTAIFVVVCTFAAVAPGGGGDRPDLLEWRMRADAAVVIAWMLVGLFDLLLLRRVLGPRKDTASKEETHADAV